MKNIIYTRSITFRDSNRARWTIDFELRNCESTRRNKETAKEFTSNVEVSVCGSGGSSVGQCDNSIVARTVGQQQLLDFWKTYHLNGTSSGTNVQNNYVHNKLPEDYQKFVDMFTSYNQEYREHFDETSFCILCKAFSVDPFHIPQVRNIIGKHMHGNPLVYILGPGDKTIVRLFGRGGHDQNDLYVQYLFLSMAGIYNDRGYKYGHGWCGDPLPENIDKLIDNICDTIEKEEDLLTEELEAVFDMGAADFKATQEIVDMVMKLRDCDEDEAKRFIALGMHLEITFGDLNDSFEEAVYGEQLYEYAGEQYYLGTDAELESIADDMIHNDSEYEYFWRAAVASQSTTDSLSDWLDSIITHDGWVSVLNHWDGNYSEYNVAGDSICVSKT